MTIDVGSVSTTSLSLSIDDVDPSATARSGLKSVVILLRAARDARSTALPLHPKALFVSTQVDEARAKEKIVRTSILPTCIAALHGDEAVVLAHENDRLADTQSVPAYFTRIEVGRLQSEEATSAEEGVVAPKGGEGDWSQTVALIVQ